MTPLVKEYKYKTRNNSFKLIKEKSFIEDVNPMIANYKNNSIEIVEEGIFINSYFYLSFAKKEVKD